MTTRCLIGARDPEHPGTAHLRYVHSDGNPAWIVPAIRQLWAITARRDTGRLVALLLEYDWYDLNADTTTADKQTPDGCPVPGVGRRPYLHQYQHRDGASARPSTARPRARSDP